MCKSWHVAVGNQSTGVVLGLALKHISMLVLVSELLNLGLKQVGLLH